MPAQKQKAIVVRGTVKTTNPNKRYEVGDEIVLTPEMDWLIEQGYVEVSA